jgi:hypothetical protein
MITINEYVKSFFNFLKKDKISIKEKEKIKEKVNELIKELTFLYSTKKFNKKNSIYYNDGKLINNYSYEYLNKEIMSIYSNDSRQLFFHKAGTFDIRPFWNNIKKIEYIYNKYLNYYSLFSENYIKDYGVIYIFERKDIKKNLFLTEIVDAYSDIKIYGATYAKLVIENGEEIDLDYDNDCECFTFVDITEQNPLFVSQGCGKNKVHYNLQIITDGTKYSIKKYYLSSFYFECFHTLNNTYCMSWFPSKNIVLFIGHFNKPSFISQIDQVITIDFNKDNELYEYKSNKTNENIIINKSSDTKIKND